MNENLNCTTENLDAMNRDITEMTENLIDNPEAEQTMDNVPFLGNAEVRSKEADLARAIKNNGDVTAAKNDLAEAKAREISENMG